MSAGASLASERISGEADGASATTEAAGGSTEVAGASGEGAEASIEAAGASGEGAEASTEVAGASGEGAEASTEVAGASGEGAEASTEVAGASREGAGASREVAGASGAAGVAGPSAFTSGVAAGSSGAGEDSTTGVSGRASVTVARSCAPAAPAWAPATTMSSALGAGGGAAVIWPTGRLAQPERRTSISAATATYAPCSRRVMTVCPLVPRVDRSGRRRAACGRVHPSCHLTRCALRFSFGRFRRQHTTSGGERRVEIVRELTSGQCHEEHLQVWPPHRRHRVRGVAARGVAQGDEHVAAAPSAPARAG